MAGLNPPKPLVPNVLLPVPNRLVGAAVPKTLDCVVAGAPNEVPKPGAVPVVVEPNRDGACVVCVVGAPNKDGCAWPVWAPEEKRDGVCVLPKSGLLTAGVPKRLAVEAAGVPKEENKVGAGVDVAVDPKPPKD